MAMAERQPLAHWYLNTFDLSREFTPAEQREIGSRGTTLQFQAGQTILFTGDRATQVALLVSGLLELLRSSEQGRQVLVSLIRPGEVFGLLALVGPLPEPDTVKARMDSEVCFFGPERFRSLLHSRPQLTFRVIKSLKGRSMTSTNRVEAMAFEGLPARAAHTLLQLASAYGRRTPRGLGFVIPLSQQNLADLVGASRQHVNYVLAEFRAQGLVHTSPRDLVLTDPEGLHRIAAP
jgi:CRP/FNR family transcriptional regulator